MPVLCAFRDVDDVTSMKTDGRFAPFLIDAFTAYADENLVCSVMNVPVVATTRFEGYIGIIQNSGPLLTSPRGGSDCKFFGVMGAR